MTQLQLLTGGSQNDPSFHQPLLTALLEAINTVPPGGHIFLCVAFIRQSGLALLDAALTEAQERGVALQVLTSDYLDVTEPVALRRLMLFAERGAMVKIYQSQNNAGFHLKSFLCLREDDLASFQATAFVGSSNLSRAALTQSLEWNWCLKVTPQSSPEARRSIVELQQQIACLAADPRMVELTHSWIDAYGQRYRKSAGPLLRQISGDTLADEPFPPQPNMIQIQALDALQQSRAQGFKRGLVVMATGLGKTWLSAFDARAMKASSLLFVAHREEILRQAEATFQRLEPDAHTGLYTGEIQQEANWLFASVQTLARAEHLTRFKATDFDYIVVDEFHHAASPTYRRILDYFRPRFLLGITATPERTDQADILALCDDNLVFETGLREGIVAGYLVPLLYQGIYDENINYDEIPWRNGRFDPEALDHAFASRKRAEHALQKWRQHAGQRTLAFCISIKHAEFMAEFFSKAGVKAVAVYAGSAMARNAALQQLDEGDLQVIFSVDLFNEGTDLPAIDTVLMLRPTESRIVFLQQLGRGLRLHPGKTHLVAIDLVGNHKACLSKPYLLQSLLSGGNGSGKGEMGKLPEGCFVNLEPELVPLLEKLKAGIRVRVEDDYRTLKEQLGYRPSAAQIFHYGVDFSKLRKQHGSWFALVHGQRDLNEQEAMVFTQHREFLLGAIETAGKTKCFKFILLQAFLNLDGLRNPPALSALAKESRLVLERHPDLLALDLADKQKAFAADSADWLKYWKQNPIRHSTEGSSGNLDNYWFEVENNCFKAKIVPPEHAETLHGMMQELIDLRLAEYRRSKGLEQRIAKLESSGRLKEVAVPASFAPLDFQEAANEVPYFPNLKIACGHFKTGRADEVEMQQVEGYSGQLDPERHFLARASGNSMNGGKQAIEDGDLLLLEWITPEHAGSITDQTLAIERQDETGDSQYLLRVIRKSPDGSYLLHAHNPDYPDLAATESMRTFARLKAVLR
ncbi:DEAD/DEAH box helicase family protein [Bowmanella denitrificans]|uniref:DEAD/DEAH box helicase family protein n=1 Tax=Bowmanella denitrificans TaxID=366582 RepID=A0ABN0XUV7_9ALTE